MILVKCLFTSERMNREDDISWYHGDISRQEAEDLLLNDKIDGSFLVRKSHSSNGDFVISVLNGETVNHFQIRKHADDAFFSIVENTKIHGLESLIEYYQENQEGIDGIKLTDSIKGELPPHDSRRHGRTNLLHRATGVGNFKVVSEMLKSGYRHEAKNEFGQTSVHLASMFGHNEILQTLIENGANVNSRDTAAYTPLHYACKNNFPNTVRLLVKVGTANTQARNTENGWVPLHEAAFRGHKEVVQVLLALNAPVRPRTKKNELPADLARSQGFIECAEVLEQYRSPRPKTSRDLWYHGTLDRPEAEKYIKITGCQNGTFLVRYSTRNKGRVLTLFTEGAFYNYIIREQDNYLFIDDGPYLDSIEHVIEYYSHISDGLPTILQHPVKPRPKPQVPHFSTMPRKKKSLALTPDQSLPTKTFTKSSNNLDNSVDLFNSIHFSSNITLNTLPNCNQYIPDRVDTVEDNYISRERLRILSTLGEGEFGAVYKGKYLINTDEEIDVAIKTLREEQVESNKESFLREAQVMMKLDHHCIVKLIGLSIGPPLHMVQELMPLESMLLYIIKKKDTINPNYEFKIWAAQIACGMQYLEQQRFVHRDLAARNILLASVHQAKISDFGLSRALGADHEYYKALTGGKWPLKWYAPESYNYGTFSHKSDVWSFGVTLWEMYSFGEHPYGERKGSEAIEAIGRGERLLQPDKCPDAIYEIMRSCWEYDANKRPTFDELFTLFQRDNEYLNIKELIPERNLT